MQKLIDGLTETVGAKKALAKHSAAAVTAFVDFRDIRQNGCASAYIAAESGALNALRLLHENRADLNMGDIQQGTVPCGIAAEDGRTDIIQVLAELRADVHKAANDGVCPLHTAAHEGHVNTAKLLLQLRADVNVQDNDERLRAGVQRSLATTA